MTKEMINPPPPFVSAHLHELWAFQVQEYEEAGQKLKLGSVNVIFALCSVIYSMNNGADPIKGNAQIKSHLEYLQKNDPVKVKSEKGDIT